MPRLPRPAHRALLATALLAALGACDDTASNPLDAGVPDAAPGSVSRGQVLATLAADVFTPAAADFADRAAALSGAVETWAAAGGGEGPALETAREAWREAMRVWQFNELLRAGPAGEPRGFIGGEGLRDRIYSWPTTRPCGVDQNLVTERYAEPDFFTAQLVNVRGLDALEYLLFHTGPGNDCPSQVEINASGAWAALDPAELSRRRAEYARVLADGIAADAEALHRAWRPDGADFAGALAAAGADASPYASAHEALEQVFHGLFYLDQIAKDLKLAIPTGLSPDCPSATGCPGDVESPWSDLSRQNLAANLRAGRALFIGGEADGPGFDDLLEGAGAADLAEQMRADFDAAIAAVEGDDTPLAATITTDLPAAQALHGHVKAITDALKSRFAVVLDLNVPATGAADND